MFKHFWQLCPFFLRTPRSRLINSLTVLAVWQVRPRRTRQSFGYCRIITSWIIRTRPPSVRKDSTGLLLLTVWQMGFSINATWVFYTLWALFSWCVKNKLRVSDGYSNNRKQFTGLWTQQGFPKASTLIVCSEILYSYPKPEWSRMGVLAHGASQTMALSP